MVAFMQALCATNVLVNGSQLHVVVILTVAVVSLVRHLCFALQNVCVHTTTIWRLLQDYTLKKVALQLIL
jgi:nitrite reductase/ring-hydroxylating ferredoxin subunit